MKYFNHNISFIRKYINICIEIYSILYLIELLDDYTKIDLFKLIIKFIIIINPSSTIMNKNTMKFKKKIKKIT